VRRDCRCCCASGTFAALIRALIAIHAPCESRSIDTLSCPEHDVRKGPSAWRSWRSDDACPTCVVTPITVCSHWCCEDYPCQTVQAIADTLGLNAD